MGQTLTIIMYHYVRDLARSRYPQVNGLPVQDFQHQVRYVQDHYTVVSGERLVATVTGDAELPPNAALLTFDDGYLDHFTNVFPILDEAGIPGCFFPPARCILDDEVLEVNKIHHVLASVSDIDKIEERVFRMMQKWGDASELRSRDEYRAAVAGDHRFDKPQVVLVKRLLQRELPATLRRRILDRLFDMCVDVPEEVLARELYMDMHQVRCLQRHGMYVGGHGDQHEWMNRLEPDEQRAEVDRTVRFLRRVGTPPDQWIMCYPYGAHDASLRRYLRKQGCAVALSTEPRVADVERDHPLVLPRLDANDMQGKHSKIS